MAERQLLGILISVILCCISWFVYHRKKNSIGSLRLVLVLLFVCLVLVCLNLKDIIQSKIDFEKKKACDILMQQGYKIFINGMEVDYSTIDMEKYNNFSIDNEKKYIIITVN